MNVFTDGACSNNGKVNAKAGYGIYIPPSKISNDSGIKISRRIEGKQTNNTAELLAVINVFNILKTIINRGFLICIYSDSEYVIKCSGSYGKKSKNNHWKNKKGHIPNYKLVKEIYELFEKYKNVSIHYIQAQHDTKKDDNISIGNMIADKLAKDSIK